MLPKVGFSCRCQSPVLAICGPNNATQERLLSDDGKVRLYGGDEGAKQSSFVWPLSFLFCQSNFYSEQEGTTSGSAVHTLLETYY